ncbi:MAG: DUF2147 domain-containing protein [Pseudomonadota bacterium]
MTLTRFLAIALVALTPGVLNAASQMQDPAFGYWLTANGKAIVHVAPCGGTTCGKMVWVANGYDQSGAQKLDLQNKDSAQRTRPICGLDLIGGLAKDAPGDWTDGWIYNPRDGSTYSVAVESISTDELKVRGYLGIKVLGSSQVWTRVSGDRGGCV